MSTYYWVGRTLTMSLAHAVWRPTILGKDNVPRSGGVLLASNHLSFIDSFAIPVAAPRKVSFLAKQEYFTGTGLRGRFVRGFMEAGDAIPLDRDDSRTARLDPHRGGGVVDVAQQRAQDQAAVVAHGWSRTLMARRSSIAR